MLVLKRLAAFAAAVVAGLAVGGAAWAGTGQPSPWQINFQGSVTPVMDYIHWFHDWLLVIITLICIFVLILLVYAVWRFHAGRNPTPTTVTHNTLLEIAWTIIPILILVVIAIPSFRLLYYSDKATEAALTVKVTGHQWYWSYNYPDQGDFTVESRMLSEADRAKSKPQVPRLLAVDEEMVIPVNTVVRIIGTAEGGSMHGWTVPGFGVKKTVIPGRLNEGWISVKEEGLYFGQCSQICGQNHSFMPIGIRVVSRADFDKWVADKKKAAGLAPATDVASATTTPANR